MEKIEMKPLAALFQAMIVLSEYEKDESTRMMQTKIMSEFFDRYEAFPDLKLVTNVNPLSEFRQMEDDAQRQVFIRILLQIAYRDEEPDKHLYLARLLAALDR